MRGKENSQFMTIQGKTLLLATRQARVAMEKSIHTREFGVAVRLLRELRERAGMTQVELADALGKTQTFISKVERGETRLDVIQMRTLLAAMKISLADYARRLDRGIAKR